MAEISKNIRETLKTVNVKKPLLSTLAQKGTDELVQQFLSENIQLGDEGKNTVQSQLYIASFWGFYDVVKTLVKEGADLNHANTNTLWTPLHAAAFQEHGKIIMHLLDNHADPHLKDSQGRTAADFGSASNKVWNLFAASGCTRTPLNVLIKRGILRTQADSTELSSDHIKDSSAMRKTNSLLINYDSNEKNTKEGNKRSIQAASVDGDVLANDNQSSELADEQPNFNAWRN